MLSNLRITQRLGLLLVLPLVAVAVVSVPFAVDRADAARSANVVVAEAERTRAVVDLVAALQWERLSAVAYVASRDAALGPVLLRQHSTSDAMARANATRANATLGGLERLRGGVVGRSITGADAATAYHAAVLAVVNGLHLGSPSNVDVIGQRQLTSLDALLRAGEESAEIGVGLILAESDVDAARALIDRATAVREQGLELFRQQGEPGHVALLQLVTAGPTGERQRQLLAILSASGRVGLGASATVAHNGLAITTVVQSGVVNDIATRAATRAQQARIATVASALTAVAVLLLVVWLGIVVNRSVARPLRRVTLAATAVANLASSELVRVSDVDADDHDPPRLAALNLRSADEIGELASAFNRVQATAALLMEQQMTQRRNVAVMFGNIAHRTQSLVSRQLEQIDELERDETDDARLARLYRLDHLTARLRRSADSLLVIAGARDGGMIPVPTPLIDVIRSATAEIEGYRGVRIGAVVDVLVLAAAVPDLTLLIAELLENATAFSPPEVPVDVVVDRRGGLVVRVVDYGIGMSPERLQRENARLVSRERLEVAPTTMLGLFVVGRLARRHGINVQLVPTPTTGVTAEVSVPDTMLLPAEAGEPRAEPSGGRLVRGPRHALPDEVFGGFADPGRRELPAAPSGTGPPYGQGQPHGGGPEEFPWFDGPPPAVNGHGQAQLEPGDPARGGLRQRQPGRHLAPEVGSAPRLVGPARPVGDSGRPQRGPGPVRDAEAERASLDALVRGSRRADEDFTGGDQRSSAAGGDQRSTVAGGDQRINVAAGDPGRGGLQRRRPGEHLAAEVRHAETLRRATRPAAPPSTRDAGAERDALTGYLDGLARAAASRLRPPMSSSPTPPTPREYR